MRCVIGIDGGGTKTEAILVDEQGRQLGQTVSGATNPYATSYETAERHFRELFTTLAPLCAAVPSSGSVGACPGSRRKRSGTT